MSTREAQQSPCRTLLPPSPLFAQVTAWTPEGVHVYNPGEIGARLYPGATLRSDIPIVDTEIGTTYILILVGDVLNDN